jgi:hypothetical protein
MTTKEKTDPSPSPTISSEDDIKVEKTTSDTSHAGSESRTPSALDNHKFNAEGFGRASDVESQRPPLYPVTSYASQIGGEGTFADEDVPESGERDPNLVEWDGPDDPHNPYNWYNPKQWIAMLMTRTSKYRWWLTFLVSIMTLCVAFTSSV